MAGASPSLRGAGTQIVVRSTTNKLSTSVGRASTAWGDIRRSQNKGYRGKQCSRCTGERDTTGTYCRRCRRAYRRLREILGASA